MPKEQADYNTSYNIIKIFKDELEKTNLELESSEDILLQELKLETEPSKVVHTFNRLKEKIELKKKNLETEVQEIKHEVELLNKRLEETELQKNWQEEKFQKVLENKKFLEEVKSNVSILSKDLILCSQHLNQTNTELSAEKVDEDIDDIINSEEQTQNCSPLGEVDNGAEFL